MENFKTELTNLLKKHNATILFNCDIGSNFNEIINPRMEVINSSAKSLVCIPGYYIETEDLR